MELKQSANIKNSWENC